MPNKSPYPKVVSGEVTGAATYAQLPNIQCDWVLIKAIAANTGKVAIGTSAAVTLPANTTDVTSGLELSAGEQMMFQISNLNLLFFIATSSADGICYFAHQNQY